MLTRMVVGRRQVLWEAMGLGEVGGVAEAPLAAAIALSDRAAECQQKRRKKKRKQQQKASAAAKANVTMAAKGCQNAIRKPMKKRKQCSKDGGRSCVEQVQPPPAATVTEACGNQHRVKRSRRDQVGHREPENACVASLPHLPAVPALAQHLRLNAAEAAEIVAKEQLEAAALAYASAQERMKQLRLEIERARQSTPMPPAADSPRIAMVGPQRKAQPQAATPSAPEIGAREGVKTPCDEASSSFAQQALHRHLFTANSDPKVQSPTQSASNLLSFVPSTIETGCSGQPHADHHAQEDIEACADSGMLPEAGVQARSAGDIAATLRTQEAACGDSEHQAAPNSVDQGKDWRQQAAVLDGDGQSVAAELPTRAASPAPMLQPPQRQRQAQRETSAAHGNLQTSQKPAMASRAEDAVPIPHAVAQDAVVAGHSQSMLAPGSGRASDTHVQAEGERCHAGQTCSPSLGLASPAQTTHVRQAAKAVSDIQGTAMRDDAPPPPPPHPETHTSAGTAAAELLNSCQHTPRKTKRAQQTNNALPMEASSMEALNRVCNAPICRGSQGALPYALGNATNARALARRARSRTGGDRSASNELPPAAANKRGVQEADACRRVFAETSAAGARRQAHASAQQDAQGQRTPNVRRPVVLPSRIPAVNDTIVIVVDSDSEPVLQPSHAENNDVASRLKGGSPQSGKRCRLVRLSASQQQPHAEAAGLHPVAKAAVEADAGAAGATMETMPDPCLWCSEAVDRMVELPCGHEFHIPCVCNWLINCQNTCPQCRARITDVGSRHVPFINQREATDADQLHLTRTAQELQLSCMALTSSASGFPLLPFQVDGFVTAATSLGLLTRWSRFHGHDAPPFNWFYYRDMHDPVTQGNPDRRARAPAPATRAKRVKLVDGLGPCMRCKQQRKGAKHCRLAGGRIRIRCI
eukprot:jgi/Chlat1/5028/Chrsp32S04988